MTMAYQAKGKASMKKPAATKRASFGSSGSKTPAQKSRAATARGTAKRSR